jgi:hypothetical protein
MFSPWRKLPTCGNRAPEPLAFRKTHIRKNAQLLHRQIFDALSKTPAFRRNPLKIKVVREAGLEPASLSAQDP